MLRATASRLSHYSTRSGPQRHRVRMAAAVSTATATDVGKFIEKMNVEYEKVHKEYEDNFWSTKMALKVPAVMGLCAMASVFV